MELNARFEAEARALDEAFDVESKALRAQIDDRMTTFAKELKERRDPDETK